MALLHTSRQKHAGLNILFHSRQEAASYCIYNLILCVCWLLLSLLFVPRVQVSEPCPQQQFKTTPNGYLPLSDKNRGNHHFDIAIQKSVLAGFTCSQQKKRNLCPVFQVTPNQGIGCSWKNILDDKLQTGLLGESLFLAHLYKKNPHSEKEKWEKHKLHSLHEAGTNTMSCCACFLSR